jgi:hypothetical protein
MAIRPYGRFQALLESGRNRHWAGPSLPESKIQLEMYGRGVLQYAPFTECFNTCQNLVKAASGRTVTSQTKIQWKFPAAVSMISASHEQTTVRWNIQTGYLPPFFCSVDASWI